MPLPLQAMTRLTILDAGPYTTLQDAGRTGHQALGVPEGGAMDEDARICGNWLVGNPADAAGLETYMGGLRFTTDGPLTLALTGTPGDSLQVTCADGHIQEVAAGCSIHLSGGERVFLPPMRHSNLAFIALSGALGLPSVYGSLSTSLNARLGGLEGRRLASQDSVNIKIPHSPPPARKLDRVQAFFAPAEAVRVVLGPQDYAFSAAEIDKLLGTQWTLSAKMDRMGIRLNGPSIQHKNSADILSDGIVKGAVQVPGDGQPIIMMADHQTTGGYTKIACVISADLGKLARVHPHKKIRFQSVTQSQAEELAQQHKTELTSLKRQDIS